MSFENQDSIRLAFGVAVAAAAVHDAELGQAGAERAAGERGAVVGAERQLARPDAALEDGGVDHGCGFLGAAADLQ